MNSEEVITGLKHIRKYLPPLAVYDELICSSIEMVEKQIPKPIKGKFYRPECPTCGEYVQCVYGSTNDNRNESNCM